MTIVFIVLAVLFTVYAFIHGEFPRVDIHITHRYPDKNEEVTPVNTVNFVAPEEPPLTKTEEEEALRSDIASMVNAIMKGDFDLE